MNVVLNMFIKNSRSMLYFWFKLFCFWNGLLWKLCMLGRLVNMFLIISGMSESRACVALDIISNVDVNVSDIWNEMSM